LWCRIMAGVIRVENLDAGYGKLQVLFNVDAVFEENLITAIVGPNGSGKSTLLKSIMGITNIFGGRVIFDGKDITKKPPHYISNQGIAYLPQVGNVFSTLSVYENLRLAAYSIPNDEVEDRIEYALEFFPVLRQYMDRKVGRLSGGERQMVAMAMALIRKPKVMMFDEPSANLAPKLAAKVIDEISRLREELGITIVIVEQIVKLALSIADKAYLLVSGSVRFSGSAQDLLNRSDLGKLYLGIV